MMSMAEAYKRQRERESLPCHNRNLDLGWQVPCVRGGVMRQGDEGRC
jgi:hypothetical protein